MNPMHALLSVFFEQQIFRRCLQDVSKNKTTKKPGTYSAYLAHTSKKVKNF
jgi:hypothetical protein